MQAGRRGRRPLRVRNRMCGSDRRDDVGIVPYARFLFFPVGRGQCAPPLEVRCVSAAAHMGAALQEITGRVRQIGRGRTPPLRIGWRCGAKGVRIATPVCAPVRNDKDFVGGAMHVGGGVRGANRAPPVAEEAR